MPCFIRYVVSQLKTYVSLRYLGGGILPEILAGVCGPLPKTPTLFMTKIYAIPFSIYDLTKNSKPYL